MAVRDVRNFKFLKNALIQKFRRPKDLSFKGIPYEPATNPQSIFGMFYNTFRELIQSKHLNLGQYLNIADRSVLEKLYLNLKKDPNLKFLDDADSVLNDPRYELTAQYYQTQSQEALAAQQSEPVPVGAATGGETPATMAGGQPSPTSHPPIPSISGILSTPSISTTPAAPPEVEVPTKTPVPDAFTKAFANEPEYKLDPTKKPPSEPAVRPTSTAKEVSAPSFQPKTPAFLTNIGKDLGSSVRIGIKKGLVRTGSRFSGIFGGVGGGLGGILSGIGGGGVRFLGGAGNALSNIGTRMTRSRGITIPKKIWLFLLGFLFLAGLLTIVIPTPVQSPVTPPIVALPAENLSGCTFYRSGDRTQNSGAEGLKFRIAQWPALINDVASKVGVPPAILAGLLRVESGSRFYSPDPDYINNDYDKDYSCDKNSPPDECIPFAYGVMQFYPPTFEGVFNRNSAELESLFGKTSVTTEIHEQDQMASDDVLRIYSIGDSVIAAAFKVKNDAGNPPYDRGAIEKIVKSYFTQCEYTQNGETFNYCDDLWKSYAECQLQQGVIADASCPIDGGAIGCASYGKVEPWGGFGGDCAPDSTGNGGHCNQNYVSAVGICGDVVRDENLIRTAKSIDISNNSKAGDPVALPVINSKPVRWKYIGAVSAGGGIDTVTPPGSSVPKDRPKYGWIRIFHTEGAEEGIWTLHLVHVEENLPPIREGDILGSGLNGARILNPWISGDNWPHVHVTIGLNVGDSKDDLKNYDRGWKFADRELGMCTK